MKILVTGGSGYLGTHIRQAFSADDLSRRSGYDVTRHQQCRMVAEYDVVIHLAARMDKSAAGADETFMTNVQGTVNVLRYVREGAAFIFGSTKDVYGRFAGNYAEVGEDCPTLYSGQSPLEWSKLVAERYVEYYAHQRGFRSCIFRLSTVYGPMTPGNEPNFVGHYADALNKGERLRLAGGGHPRRDLLHVDDLTSACRAFADSVISHGLYNLGGGRANTLTLSELVTKLEEVSGLQAVIDAENPLPDPFPVDYVTNLGRVKQELGWSPEMSLDDGLKTLF